MQYRYEREQSEPAGTCRALAKRRTVEIEKLTRQMQYRNEREQSEPAGDYIAPARRRTVEIEKLTRQMQYRYEREQSEPAGTCEKQRYCSFSLSTAAGRG